MELVESVILPDGTKISVNSFRGKWQIIEIYYDPTEGIIIVNGKNEKGVTRQIGESKFDLDGEFEIVTGFQWNVDA